jgi:ribosome-associated toxin RatA of RatAB toxin-antitoxin module
MVTVQRTVLVEFSAAQMHALVSDIEAYPAFLPWCSSATIGSREATRVVATLKIDYRGLRQAFTTENTSVPDESIRLRLVSGPFRRLEGEWRFQALAENACKVSLQLEYEFSGRLLETVLGPVFHYIADSMVDAFVRRAEAVFSRK